MVFLTCSWVSWGSMDCVQREQPQSPSPSATIIHLRASGDTDAIISCRSGTVLNDEVQIQSWNSSGIQYFSRFQSVAAEPRPSTGRNLHNGASPRPGPRQVDVTAKSATRSPCLLTVPPTRLGKENAENVCIFHGGSGALAGARTFTALEGLVPWTQAPVTFGDIVEQQLSSPACVVPGRWAPAMSPLAEVIVSDAEYCDLAGTRMMGLLQRPTNVTRTPPWRGAPDSGEPASGGGRSGNAANCCAPR